MLFYPTLFLSLLYFKIFRVRRQHEKVPFWTHVKGLLTIVFSAALIIVGALDTPWYILLGAVVVMNIMASLMITTVQLGIFIDGRPLFKISAVYRLMPLLALLVITGSAATITTYYLG